MLLLDTLLVLLEPPNEANDPEHQNKDGEYEYQTPGDPY
jgi:hypothetical protein